MTFISYLKSKLKFLFGIAGIAALISQLALPASSTIAAEPRFNFLPGDLEMIRGVNVSRDEATWHNPLTGNAGEIMRGLVYYHNGVVDTVATNTKIKVNIPASTTNQTAKITGSISADNAGTVTSTVVDGQIVGLDGLVINLDQDATMQFIPGSVRWFPNSNQNGGPSQLPQSLPFGQSGDEIVSGSGVNIGDIQGCWPFAGFISFDFKTIRKVVPPPEKKLNIEKTVKNVSKGENTFDKETNAQIGETVQFKVEPFNSGNAPLSNAILKDFLPTELEFIPGSFERRVGGAITPLPDGEAAIFFDGGLNIGTLDPNEREEFFFKAKVRDDCKIDAVVNKAQVSAEGLIAESTAVVRIVRANIVMNKSAFDNTRNKPATEVGRGDLITYTLTAKNTGNAQVTNFSMKDDINQVLRFADIVSISDSGAVSNGNVIWPATTLNPGDTVTRTFQVRVKNDIDDSKSQVCFTNVFGNEVRVCVEKKVVKQPILHIEKKVRNVTSGESNFEKSNQAFAGDTLEYLVDFSNTGNGSADQVKFSDTLPPNTQFIAGTTRISRNGGPEQTLPDGITGSGAVIDSIAAGETGFIKFRIKTSSSISAGENLVNTVFLTQAGQTISSTATTTIKAQPVVAAAAAVTTQLPKTGATAGASFMLTFLLGVGFLYFKYRRFMASGEVEIINQMLSA